MLFNRQFEFKRKKKDFGPLILTWKKKTNRNKKKAITPLTTLLASENEMAGQRNRNQKVLDVLQGLSSKFGKCPVGSNSSYQMSITESNFSTAANLTSRPRKNSPVKGPGT